MAGEEEVVVAAEVRLLLRRHRSLEQARFLDCLADRHCLPLDRPPLPPCYPPARPLGSIVGDLSVQ